jgi:adenine deaminase
MLHKEHFPSEKDLWHLGRVILETEKPDLVVAGGEVFSPYTKKFLPRDIWIYKKWVAAVIPPRPLSYYQGIGTIDAREKKVLPGLIDGHIHIESTLLNPIEFARLAASCGVTTVYTDFHELASVVDSTAFHRFITSIPSELPCKIFLFFPHNLLNVDYVSNILQYEGLCELFYHSIFQDLQCAQFKIVKILSDLRKQNKLIEGHLFQILTEQALSLCRASGIRSDHEARSAEEVRDKILLGLFIFLRSGTLAREGRYLLRKCLELGLPLDRIGLVTDDILVRDMTPDNYMLRKIQDAINQGVSLEEAINMVTYNVAHHFRIDEFVGTIIPGSCADLVILNDDFTIHQVISGGRPLDFWDAKNIEWNYPSDVLRAVITRGKLSWESLENAVRSVLRVDRIGKNKFLIRAILFNETSRFTQLKDVQITLADSQYGKIFEDVCYIFSFDRHSSSHIGVGFITGYGLTEGAIATSISHDKHHILAIGKNLYDIAMAVNRLVELNGGIVLSVNGQVIEEISLPIGGLMSLEPYATVRKKTLRLHQLLKDLGVHWNDPIFPVFWLGMEEAPEVRITPDGVINTLNKTIVDVLIEEKQ